MTVKGAPRQHLEGALCRIVDQVILGDGDRCGVKNIAHVAHWR